MVLNGGSGGVAIFRPEDYVDTNKKELRTTREVVENVQNIMADVYSKDEDVLGFIHSVLVSLSLSLPPFRVEEHSSRKPRTLICVVYSLSLAARAPYTW